MNWKKKVLILAVLLISSICVVGLYRRFTEARSPSMGHVKGVIVNLEPLTICRASKSTSDSERIYLVDTGRTMQNQNLEVGKVISVSYTEVSDFGPPVLEKVSEIDVMGAASEEEIAMAKKHYTDYMLSLKP